MKTTKWICVALLASSVAAQAQTNISGAVPVPVQPEIIEAEVMAPASRRTVIVPAQQQQPTTYVEARPLVKTRADEMRELRQQTEAATEAKIVERLELARLEDEKRRAERLFGDRFQAPVEPVMVPVAQVAPTPIVQPTPVPMPTVIPVAPVEVIVAEEKSDAADLEGFKEEIITSINELKKEKEKKSETYYVSGVVGTADYVDVSNVDSNMATGVTIGRRDSEGFTVEGSLIYSNFYVDEGYWSYGNPVFQEMDQYNFNVGVKYSPLLGRIRPTGGALISYVYRKYGEFYSNWSGSYETGNSADSKSFDMGITGGIDIDVTDSFTVGFEYKYMMNISSKTSSPYLGSRYINSVATPIEELNYQMFTLSAKARF